MNCCRTPSFLQATLCTLLVFATFSRCQAQPYGLAARPAIGAFLNNLLPETAPVVPANWTVVPAFPNLNFTNLLGVLPVPGTNLLCAWEREGRVWTFVNNSNIATKTLVIDLSNQCQGWDDSGLLGLAFHPGYATNKFMFLYYTWVTPGTVVGSPTARPPEQVIGKYHDRLSRFVVGNGVAALSSELVFVDQIGDSVWHNGGGMFFHPTNGFLYWTDGDDERAPTQQIVNNLFSGVFRIDVDQRGGAISHAIPRQPTLGTTANYFIPNDNPFVGQANVLEEFYCLGLRSPHRMTIDPPTGKIYIGDVGAGAREEISLMSAGESGLNFQWSVIEGLNGDLTPPYVGINRRPILDYTHAEGQAVIGGYVYRGSEFAAELGGRYLFGDNVTRTIWYMNESTTPATKVAIATLPKGSGPNSGSDYTGLSSFGLDASNELYLCQMSSIGGRIFKLSAGSPVASRPLPTLLSQTGAFTNLTTLAPNPVLVPYTVNSPLWSDSTVKARWLALATNTTITFATNGEWTFPSGTVFVKNFDLPVNDTNPAVVKRLETRLLVVGTNGLVYGASYKWRADYSDADLVNNLTNENITITTATGVRTQVWSFPGRQDCLTCHTIPSGGVLGVKTRQLNGTFGYPATGVTDNQLRAWNHVGLFSTTLSEAAIPGYSKLVDVSDTNATLELRARSYLDANCAHCHRPNGGVQANFDARFDTPLDSQGIIGGAVQNNLGISGAYVVAPADTNKSILYQRDNSLASIKMPPLAKNTVDAGAMAVIVSWIMSLPSLTNALPLPWQHTDVGGVGLAGNATYAGGQFTVIGGGDDIWNNADAFHYVYQPLTGDGSVTAHVVSFQNTDGWAKAGVMFRETLGNTSAHVSMFTSYANATAFQYRNSIGGASTHTAGPFNTAPYWVRLTRAGSSFTGFVSPDGVAWTQVGSVTIGMNSQINVGLAVTAHNNSLLNTGVLDNVIVTVATNISPTITLTAPANGSLFTSPTSIAMLATASASNGGITNVSFLREMTRLGDDALPPYNFTWANAAVGTFALRAIASDSFGAMGTSAPVNVTIQTLLGTNVWSAKVNFQTNGATLFAGYLPDSGLVFGNRGNGFSYGWDVDNTANGRRRSSTNFYDARYDTFNHLQKPGGGTTWEIAIPNGTYQVRIVAGDADFVDGNFQLNAEGVLVVSGAQTTTTRWAEGFGIVTVNDGRLTVGNSAGAVNNKIAFLEISTFVTNLPPITLVAPTRTNGVFQFALQGLNGVYYVVEASTNLARWTPLATNMPVNNLLQFAEPATNFPAKFYRGRLP